MDLILLLLGVMVALTPSIKIPNYWKSVLLIVVGVTIALKALNII